MMVSSARPQRVQLVEDAHDRGVDEHVQVVVQPPVREVGVLRVQELRPHVTELRVGSRDGPRTSPTATAPRGCRGSTRGTGGNPSSVPPESAEPDVVRVHERRHRQPGRVVVGRRQLGEQVDHLFGEHAVAHESAVGLVGTVRLAPDPPREPELVEPVGAPVGVDRGGVDDPVDVVRPQALVGAGHHQVGVRDVPLAPVVGAVAGGAEPVPHRRHGVGIEEVHGRVGGRLGEAVGVGDPVQRRVLAGEQRGPARRDTPWRPRSGGAARGSARAGARGRGAACGGTRPAPPPRTAAGTAPRRSSRRARSDGRAPACGERSC